MRKPPAGGPYWVFVFLYCLFIFYLSAQSNPLPKIARKIFADWILHGVEYGVFGFFLAGALRFSLRIKTFSVLVIGVTALGALYGATDEIHQLFVPRRQCSVWDLAADITGSFCGAVIFWILVQRARKKKASVNAADQRFLQSSL